jgi:hypothetical protein
MLRSEGLVKGPRRADKRRRQPGSVLTLRVPVLAALEPFEDGAERLFAGGLVLFQRVCFPGEPGDEARQSRPAFGREYAPGEETV